MLPSDIKKQREDNQAIMNIFLDNCVYFYDFDLGSGIIEKDIIGKDGTNYMKKLGLTAPCTYDELMDRCYESGFTAASSVVDETKGKLCRQFLLEECTSGKFLVEETVYHPEIDQYHRIAHYLITDAASGKIHVYVSCFDITANEKSRQAVFGDLVNDKSEIEDIVASAEIGIWHIYMFDGEAPRMQATPVMAKLLGINPDGQTEEELYDAWYSNIKKSSLPLVQDAVKQIIEEGFGEITYAWVHPTRGEIFVRCGGTSMKVEGKGYILRGYHMDVTDTVNAEAKQKQLLADALEEVQRQKFLLQEALDNYKEADYDRRRDFLTGLRNRQDMFELLQDVLSGRREKIQTMYMMDIDNFKLLNDHYGHTYGDECLIRVSQALLEYGKEHDMYFYRYGGEEILGISFSETAPSAQIAKELVDLVADLKILRDDIPAGVVTISLGYTTDNQRYEKMIDRADTAMYKAKANGKNQVVCYEDLLS